MLGAFVRGCISIPLQLTARIVLKLWGWTPVGTTPTDPQYVMLAAPHTSNWDAVIMLAMASYYRIRIRWLVKSAWLVGPLGWFLKATGAIGIDRSAAHGVVDQMIAQFGKDEPLILLVPPEGTRGKKDHWKSGFYRIAVGAKVPIVSGIMDWKKKETGIADIFMPTGNLKADMDHLRSIYDPATGRHPALYTPCRLREEDDA